jgi:phenylacetic acid degradation protein
MPFYALENLVPAVDKTAFIHPTAVLIGDVIIGPHCYVGPNASLRGDFGRITMLEGSNVQDNCVLHSFPEKDCLVEENGHIGHGAILHGCLVQRNALIGMNAVVMDGAIIATESFVAASAFVKSGFECEPRSLIVGSPASVKRSLSEQEVAWKTKGTQEYKVLSQRCLKSLREVQPLTEPQPQRPRFNSSEHKPKSST